MIRLMARFQRDTTKVKLIRDPMGGYFIITDKPQEQTVEHFPLHLYPVHCDLYQENGYERLVICRACLGQGWRWVPANRGEEVEREMCPDCQGEGGS